MFRKKIFFLTLLISLSLVFSHCSSGPRLRDELAHNRAKHIHLLPILVFSQNNFQAGIGDRSSDKKGNARSKGAAGMRMLSGLMAAGKRQRVHEKGRTMGSLEASVSERCYAPAGVEPPVIDSMPFTVRGMCENCDRGSNEAIVVDVTPYYNTLLRQSDVMLRKHLEGEVAPLRETIALSGYKEFHDHAASLSGMVMKDFRGADMVYLAVGNEFKGASLTNKIFRSRQFKNLMQQNPDDVFILTMVDVRQKSGLMNPEPGSATSAQYTNYYNDTPYSCVRSLTSGGFSDVSGKVTYDVTYTSLLYNSNSFSQDSNMFSPLRSFTGHFAPDKIAIEPAIRFESVIPTKISVVEWDKIALDQNQPVFLIQKGKYRYTPAVQNQSIQMLGKEILEFMNAYGSKMQEFFQQERKESEEIREESQS